MNLGCVYSVLIWSIETSAVYLPQMEMGCNIFHLSAVAAERQCSSFSIILLDHALQKMTSVLVWNTWFTTHYKFVYKRLYKIVLNTYSNYMEIALRYLHINL